MAREHWGTRLGFVLAAAGSAVGLGNIWKFPYLVGENGGGAFLLVYLALVLTVGLSVVLAEIAIGRAAHRDPAGAFAQIKGGAWPLVGWLGVVAGFIVLSFYSVIGGWTIAYVVKTLDGELSSSGVDLAASFSAFISDPVGVLGYHALFMALTVLIVIKGIGEGIERWTKILMPGLFVLLLVLIVRSLTLDGAAAGLEFYLKPDFSKFSGALFSEALSQAFFSLSLGMGIMITYGSYIGRKENLPQATLWVTLLDTLVAFLAGLLIMPAVFAFGVEPGAGPGLTFITLPGVFAQMPGGVIFGTLFFVLLAIAALTSSVSLLEVSITTMIDQLKVKRITAATTLGALCFLLGVPSALSLGPWSDVTVFGLGFLDLFDYVTAKIMMPLGGLFVALFVGWVVWPKMRDEVSNDGTRPFPLATVWAWMCRVVAPAAIAWILIWGLIG